MRTSENDSSSDTHRQPATSDPATRRREANVYLRPGSASEVARLDETMEWENDRLGYRASPEEAAAWRRADHPPEPGG